MPDVDAEAWPADEPRSGPDRADLAEDARDALLLPVVVSARELVGARHAVLALVGPRGEVEQVVHDDGVDGAALLGPPDEGRLDHPAPSGAISLAVPVRVRGVVAGHLRLTGRDDGRPFAEEDERTARVLAVAAGVALENARRYEDSRRRQQWAEATARIAGALLDLDGRHDPVGMVADTVLRLDAADVVSVVVPVDDGASLRVELARGPGAAELVGLVYPAERSVAAAALRSGRALRIGFGEERDPFSFHVNRVIDVGAVMAVPLHGSARSHGVLVVARRRGRPVFEESDLDLSESFAVQAAVALELAEARQDRHRLALLQERERIARDLHDHVIQRLFACGLSLEAVETLVDEDPRTRVAGVVEDLNVTIRRIRDTIYRLQHLPAERTVRSTVLDVAAASATALGFAPLLSFDGAVDALVDPRVLDDLDAVSREALSNVARHAHASSAAVSVRVTLGELRLVVSDDGSGVAGSGRRSGLRNMEQRALDAGGEFEVVDGPRGGTEVRWSIPLG